MREIFLSARTDWRISQDGNGYIALSVGDRRYTMPIAQACFIAGGLLAEADSIIQTIDVATIVLSDPRRPLTPQSY